MEDAITIGLTDKGKNQSAAEGCRKLQISNIRTIQKIDSTLHQLRDVLTEIGITVPESFDLQLQTTTVLATWAYWERVIDINDLEKLEPGDSMVALMEEAQPRLSEKQKDLYQRVRDYGYAYSDDTDKMIIRFIKAGALDKEEMQQRVQENDAAMAKRQRDEAIARACEVYRGTLRPNVGEVVTALYDAHLAGIEDVSASHLAQAVRVIRELGAEDKANELTERFFSRTAPVDNYDSYPFKEMGHDERFVEKWREKTAAEAPDERTLEETINSCYYDKSNAMTDFKRLAQFGEDEFYEWFKGTGNPKVLSMASALSQIQYRLPLAQTEIEKIERDARAALRRISAENKISEVRLRHLEGPAITRFYSPSGQEIAFRATLTP